MLAPVKQLLTSLKISRSRLAAVSLLLFVLLLLCDRPFSAIYSNVLHGKESLVSRANERNDQRTDQARDYFTQMPKRTLQQFQNISQSENHFFNFTIAIITVNRKKKNSDKALGYLLQSAASLDSLIKSNTFFQGSFLFVCNVDQSPENHEDATLLKDYLPFVERYGSSSVPGISDLPIPGTDKLYKDTQHINTFDRERHDYTFCLQTAWQFHSQYYLIFQDDAIPHPHFTDVLELSLAKVNKRQLCLKNETSSSFPLLPSYTSCLLDHPPYSSGLSPQTRLISPSPNSSFAFLKFYFPERWQGFAFELLRLEDMASLSAVSGGLALVFHALFTILTRKQHFQPTWKVFLYGMLCGLLVSNLLGRQNINELRRLSKYFYRFQEAPNCCVPAMLYPAPVVPFLVTWLAESPDRSKVDLRISDCFQHYQVPGYYVEPNIVRHVGMVTSLEKVYQKPVEEFLFR